MDGPFTDFFLVVVLNVGHFSLSYPAISGSQTSRYLLLQDVNSQGETVYKGLKFFTSMAFLAVNDVVLEKNEGTVKRIINGTMLDRPLFGLNVAYIFLYLTDSTEGEETGGLLHGRLYRYELINDIPVIFKILPLG